MNMRYHITIIDKTTGAPYIDDDAAAILGVCHTLHGVHTLGLADCTICDIAEALSSLQRLDTRFRAEHRKVAALAQLLTTIDDE